MIYTLLIVDLFVSGKLSIIRSNSSVMGQVHARIGDVHNQSTINGESTKFYSLNICLTGLNDLSA